jgi:putative Mg2+ transporter-C (MgtC) family protein
MFSFEQMLARFIVALILGAILGVERELVSKEAGVRTEMLVAGGASIFTMIGLSLPYFIALSSGTTLDAVAQVSGFAVIANIVVGVGFLGAGLIIKINEHPHGITTAALVWMTAAIGMLAGIGMFQFAAVSALLTAALLYLLRKLDFSESLRRHGKENG